MLLRDYCQFLRQVHKRKGMYGLKTWSDFHSFVLGLDYGANNELLNGFERWIVIRTDEQRNLWFPGVIRRYVGIDDSDRSVSEVQDDLLIDTFLGLLEEYFEAGNLAERLDLTNFLHRVDFLRRRHCHCCGYLTIYTRENDPKPPCKLCGWPDVPILDTRESAADSAIFAELLQARIAIEQGTALSGTPKPHHFPKLRFDFLSTDFDRLLMTKFPEYPDSLGARHLHKRLRYLNLLATSVLIAIHTGSATPITEKLMVGEQLSQLLTDLKTAQLERAEVDQPLLHQMASFCEAISAAWKSDQPVYGVYGWQRGAESA